MRSGRVLSSKKASSTVTTAATSAAVDVCVAGSLAGWTTGSSNSGALNTGYVYYTNTMGTVIQGNSYYGRDVSGASSTEYYYYYDATSNTILTLDSKIGFATATDTLFVQLLQ